MTRETMRTQESMASGAPSAGAFSGPVHHFPLRVYYEDTDAGGVAYYANYLKFAERARTEMMHLLDAGYGDLVSREGFTFAVRRCEVDYMSPARLGDILEIRTRITEAKGASHIVDQAIRRDGDDLVRLLVRLVCINREGRPARMPEILRNALQSLIQP